MGVLHQWRIETELSSLDETELSKQTVNQFFFFFYSKIALWPISYGEKCLQ